MNDAQQKAIQEKIISLENDLKSAISSQEYNRDRIKDYEKEIAKKIHEELCIREELSKIKNEHDFFPKKPWWKRLWK